MAVLNLSVLTLVSSEKTERGAAFRLRPLFLMYPSVVDARYEHASELFKRDLHSIFTGFQLTKVSEDMLFWMMFQPEFHFQKRLLHVKIGKSTISGSFSVVDFMVGEHTFVLLPNVQNYMCMAKREANEKIDIDKTAEQALRHIFKKLKDDFGDEFDPSAYFSPKREYVTTIEARVEIKDGPFSFEQKDFLQHFMRLGDSTDFNGAEELSKSGHELNRRFPDSLKRAFHREREVELLFNRMFAPAQVPLAVVGPEGVGRHTLIEEAVFRYLNNHLKTNPNNRPKTIWHLDPVRIITGMSIVGMWQKRFEAMIRHIITTEQWVEKPDVMMVDNPVALLRVGRYSGGNMALSDVLKPYLEKRRFPFILIATPEEWSIVQEQDRRFSSLFQVFRVEESPRSDLIPMLLEKRKLLEREHGVVFQIQAIDQMLHIHRNYLSNKALPGGVAKMMEQLAVKFRFRTIDAQEVRAEFQLVSGLAEVFLDDSQTLEAQEVEAAIGGMLVGQPDALEALTSVVHLIKSKLTDRTKPAGSFLFAGPTGVGKTQAAKALCKILTGSDTALMRFDMNEYIDAGSIQRLIGDISSPDGKLTSTVRHNPFGVLLLDEVEKAHPKVHDLLLQVLDDGRLSDSLGRTVDFTNVVVIMTSNLGAHEAASAIGFAANEEDIRTVYVRAVERFFRPEFVNRIDHIIAFRSLEEEHIYDIARLQLRELLQRDGFVRRTSILNVDQHALRWVAKRGYDSRMGGRALKRQIEKDLTELSAEQLITTPAGSPIILDIFLEDERLKPRIRAIDMVQPAAQHVLPQMPDEANGRPFLQKLLRKAEAFQGIINSYKNAADAANHISEADMAYYELKERIEQLKEKIKHLLLSYKGSFVTHRPVSPLRLKISTPLQYGMEKDHLKEKIFRDEAVLELRDAHRHASPQYNPVETLFMELFLDTAFLQLHVDGFTKERKDILEIRFSSLVSGLGRTEIAYLMDNYEAFCRHADLVFRVRKNTARIEIEGYGLYDLLAAETGIHLFTSSFDNSIPVLVWVRRPEDPEEMLPALKVLRLYDNSKLLTDLRTGLTNDMQITPQELKLLLYGGFQATGRLPEYLNFQQ